LDSEIARSAIDTAKTKILAEKNAAIAKLDAEIAYYDT